MLTREQTDLLTRTGPGTPCGKLLRHYWQPVALSKEIPLGGAPVPLHLMGEDLVLFRDDRGPPGLLGLYCSHRGTDLSYGRLEHGGLRCIYHGWLYDIHGNCLEQPGEPKGSDFKEKVRHPAYPCQERVGIVFAYLGPAPAPLLPDYEFLTVPESHVHVGKIYHDCNYLQANEGNIDPVHLSFLHSFTEPQAAGKGELNYFVMAKDVCPELEIEETGFGIRIHAARKSEGEGTYLRVTNYVFPNLCAVAGALADGYLVNWHVPLDDTHHWKYMIHFTRKAPVDKELLDKILFQGQLGPDFRMVHNRANRYLQNREFMKKWNFTGIGDTPRGSFPAQDLCVSESQIIQDRTREHLGYTDRAVIAARRMMLRAIQDLEAGHEPPHVVRDQAANRFPDLVVLSEVIPNSVDWKGYWKKKVHQELAPQQAG